VYGSGERFARAPAEFGVIAPQGLRNVGKLVAIIRDEGDGRPPALARQVLQVLAAQIESWRRPVMISDCIISKASIN
jgi:hypothetical protein